MRKPLIFFLWCALCLFTSAGGKAMAIPVDTANRRLVFQKIKMPDAQSQFAFSDSLLANPKDTIHHKKHRLIAAILAFPVIGIFGLHRIYLGTSVKVPVIYIVTLGGGLGILPFIDFVMILLSRDKEFHAKYEHNHYLFMWHNK